MAIARTTIEDNFTDDMKFEYFEETYRDPAGHDEIETHGLGKIQTSGAQIMFVGTCTQLSEALETL